MALSGMGDGIFHINKNGKFQEMHETPFPLEIDLQNLLAQYPDLMPGKLVDPTSPRRWLLITPEALIPSDKDSRGRWELDHLFLDQDAIPTFVEVKRGEDTRIRREVVGQMLDYASHAVAYVSVETFIANFEKTCEHDSTDPDMVITNFLGEGADVGEFWMKVKTNLQAGKIRMIFVADSIPSELKRIVEFLNSQMDPAEVIAVEIKQYLAEDGSKTLVPRIFGQTEKAQSKSKSPGYKPNWDAHLTGEQILFTDHQYKSVGRAGGLSGKAFEQDIKNGAWRDTLYEVRNSPEPINRNWFTIEDFIASIPDSERSNPHTLKP